MFFNDENSNSKYLRHNVICVSAYPIAVQISCLIWDNLVHFHVQFVFYEPWEFYFRFLYAFRYYSIFVIVICCSKFYNNTYLLLIILLFLLNIFFKENLRPVFLHFKSSSIVSLIFCGFFFQSVLRLSPYAPVYFRPLFKLVHSIFFCVLRLSLTSSLIRRYISRVSGVSGFPRYISETWFTPFRESRQNGSYH